MEEGDRIRRVTPPGNPVTDVTGATDTGGDTPEAQDALAPSRERTPAERKLEKQLSELYQTLSITVVSPIDQLGGQLLFHRSEELAAEWVDLARVNPKVKRALENILKAGGVFGVLAGHAMIVAAVVANRGGLPDQMAGMVLMGTVLQTPEVGHLFTHPRFHTGAQNGAGGSE